MKKSYFAIGMIALALGSCSNDSIEGPNGGNETADGREVIKLGLASSRADVSVESGARNTRGGGSVGSTDEAQNKWCYEDLYVLMTTTNPDGLETPDVADGAVNWGFTSFKGALLKEQFDGSFISRPAEAAVTAAIDYKQGTNKADKYYPINKNVTSNFFVFHVDDAFTGAETEGAVPAITTSDDKTAMTVDFTIDGSQDLMVGMADNNGEGYSCATARAGVVPEITMNHLLTRFTFMVKNGNTLTPANCAGVKVKAIRVLSKTEGTMTVAYNGETPAEYITWTEDPANAGEYVYSPLTLQRKKIEGDADYFAASLEAGKPSLIAFDETEGVYTMTEDLKPVAVGDALLVSPGDAEYKMEVDLEYTVEYMDPMNPDVASTGTESVTLPLDLALQNGSAFLAGSSYNVVVTVYGLNEIYAEVTLSKWVDGGNIGVGGDDDPTWPTDEELNGTDVVEP